jgi:drug/metabolite transporter (DMT)-like permease
VRNVVHGGQAMTHRLAPRDIATLVFVAAAWGASYIFIRIAVPVLGPWVLLSLRMGIAAACLLAFSWWAVRKIDVTTRWKDYVWITFLGSVAAQLLINYSAYRLNAAMLAILGGLAPMWAALVSRVYLNQPIGRRTAWGLGFGPIGVALVVGFAPIAFDTPTVLAIAGALFAPLLYAGAGTYMQKHFKGNPDTAGAAANSLYALPFLMPVVAWQWWQRPMEAAPLVMPSVQVIGAVLMLAVVSTAIAGRLFYNLMQRTSATVSFTALFMSPAFSLLWGWLFLGETLNLRQLGGFCVILVAMWLVATARASAPRSEPYTASTA